MQDGSCCGRGRLYCTTIDNEVRFEAVNCDTVNYEDDWHRADSGSRASVKAGVRDE